MGNTKNKDVNAEKLHVSVLGFNRFANSGYELRCIVKSGVLHNNESIVFNVGSATCVEKIFNDSYDSLEEATKGQNISVIIGPDVSASDLEKCVSFRKNESATSKTEIQKKISHLESELSSYRQTYPLSIADTFIGNSRKYLIIFAIFLILLAIAYPSFTYVMAAIFGSLALIFFALAVGVSKSPGSSEMLLNICNKINSLGDYPDLKNYIATTKEDIKNEGNTKRRRYTIGKVFLVVYTLALAAYVGYTFVKDNELMRSEWENVHVDQNLHGDLNLTAELLDLKPREPYVVLQPLEQEAGADDLAIFLVESDIPFPDNDNICKVLAYKFKTPRVDRIAGLVITDKDGNESNLRIPTHDDVSKIVVKRIEHNLRNNSDYAKEYSEKVLNTLYYLKKHQNELRYKILKYK